MLLFGLWGYSPGLGGARALLYLNMAGVIPVTQFSRQTDSEHENLGDLSDDPVVPGARKGFSPLPLCFPFCSLRSNLLIISANHGS